MVTELAEKPAKSIERDYWSADGQVFFTGGQGYSLEPDGGTVNLGDEEDIVKAFASGEIANDLCPGQAEILQGILEYQKELKEGGTNGQAERSINAKRTARKLIIGNNKRIRLSRLVGHKQPNIGRSTAK